VPPTILEQLVDESVKLRDRTKAIYRDAVERFLAFAGRDPRRWNGAMVVAWRQQLLATGAMKAQSVNLLLKGLRYATRRWSEIEGQPALDFARVAELLKPEPKQKRVSLTVDQATALIAACNGTTGHDVRDRGLLLLMLRTGARRGGVCGAELAKLDLRTGKLTITLKGGEPLELDLDDETLAALSTWVGWLRARGVSIGRLFRALKPSLSETGIEIGESLSPQRLYEIVRERAKRADIGHCFPHRLPHSFVSIGLDSGIEPWRLRLVTGHKREIQVEEYATDLRAVRREPVSARLPLFGTSP
jgi:integrase